MLQVKKMMKIMQFVSIIRKEPNKLYGRQSKHVKESK